MDVEHIGGENGKTVKIPFSMIITSKIHELITYFVNCY